MRVSGRAEGDEDGGTTGGGNFGRRDRARTAENQICLGKTLRHILDEGHNLRSEFASRISHAHSIIVAFTSLMHDEKLIFSRRQYVQRVNDGAIDGQSSAAAAGNEDVEGFAMLFARDGAEFTAHGNAGHDGFITKTLGGFRETAGHAICEGGEDTIGEAGLYVGLENKS